MHLYSGRWDSGNVSTFHFKRNICASLDCSCDQCSVRRLGSGSCHPFVSHAQCRLMEWSDRALAPLAVEAGQGCQDKGHAMSEKDK
jgi:hypothetical protein